MPLSRGKSSIQLHYSFAIHMQITNNKHSEKAVAPHSSTLAWKIQWTEEPGRLQSMGSLGVGHDWATSLTHFTSHRRKTKNACWSGKRPLDFSPQEKQLIPYIQLSWPTGLSGRRTFLPLVGVGLAVTPCLGQPLSLPLPEALGRGWWWFSC